MNPPLIKSGKKRNLKNQDTSPQRRRIYKTITVVNVSDPQIVSVEEAIKAMSEEDLTFVATYYPMMLKDMCLMMSLEDQLKKENKEIGHKLVMAKPEKFKNWFVYSWYKFKQWLFFKFGKTENIEK
tara:strand:- start:102 stop:479 length:378 start_codon:yes stop_codon:yes gene_type:complete